MVDQIENELFQFNSFEFYQEQIERTVEWYRTKGSNLFLLRDPIYSFFSGQELKIDNFLKYKPIFLSEKHLIFFVCHPSFKEFSQQNFEKFVNWIGICYFYWTTYDRMCDLGEIIFFYVLKYAKAGRTIVYLFQLNALLNMIHYVIFYKKELLLNIVDECLSSYYQYGHQSEEFEFSILMADETILGYRKRNQNLEEIYLDTINKLKEKFIEKQNELVPSAKMWLVGKFIFHDHLFEYGYKNLIDILKDEEISKDMEGGNTEYLKNIFGKLAKMGDYEKSINLLKAVSGNSLNQNFSSRHGIVIPNSQSLSLLTNSEQINYYSNDQYEKYCELIEAENIAFNLTTVLRDRPSVTYSQNIGKNYGFPNEEYDFNCILKLIISCYALDQDVMDDLNYLTIVPSHNHSVQSALVSLNKIPPIISYSLNEIVDRKIEKKFIFILGENSLLPGIEENFIFSYFGKNALIIKKPTIEVLRSIFSDDSFTHIYISAHGNYDHSSRDINSIEFEKDCVIPINFFEDFKVKDGSQRILILNSCSGAHTGINLNLNQKGLSANFLKNGFVVYSHLWPITSQYAAIVGCILLFKLNADDDLRKVYYETIQVLLNDNIDISRILLSLHPSFKELSMKIYDEEIHESRVIKLNNFRNTGSLCLYT